MTVIVNAICCGMITQVVDRQISRQARQNGTVDVVDPDSTKVCVVLCGNALLSIAYTGVAVADQTWMDSIIAGCLAHRDLANAMMQPGAPLLSRPVHMVVPELGHNLNWRLNSDKRARGLDLRVSIVGWHLGRAIRPLAWELRRGPPEPNGMRYFNVIRHPVGKFLRQYPQALWIDSLGDPGSTVDDRLRALNQVDGFDRDDLERYIAEAIASRAAETQVVGAACLAVQLHPRDSDGHAQFTYYPEANSGDDDAATFLTGWVLTPRLIASPGTESTFGSTISACGRYAIGGFSDQGSELYVRTRLPASVVHHGGPRVMAYGTQRRAVPK